MASFTQNNIQFTLNADAVTPFGGKYTDTRNYDSSTGLYNVNSNKLSNVGVFKSINAVEIDWNGAQLELPADLGGTQTIQTTGQLLSIIQQIAKVYSPIFVKAA